MRPLQPRPGAAQHRKTGSGELGGALEIENPQTFADFPVRFAAEN